MWFWRSVFHISRPLSITWVIPDNAWKSMVLCNTLQCTDFYGEDLVVHHPTHKLEVELCLHHIWRQLHLQAEDKASCDNKGHTISPWNRVLEKLTFAQLGLLITQCSCPLYPGAAFSIHNQTCNHGDPSWHGTSIKISQVLHNQWTQALTKQHGHPALAEK
jgi:hypothetical protein